MPSKLRLSFTCVAEAFPSHDADHTGAVHNVCNATHERLTRMQTVRARLLEGRGEELSGLARALHQARLAEGRKADGVADYYAAETLLIQETFQRQLGCQVSLLSALRVSRVNCAMERQSSS